MDQKSWPDTQIDYLIDTFSSYYNGLEEHSGCKVLFLNSLNMVYSKAKDSFFLGNLQNIITPQEMVKMREIEDRGTVLEESPAQLFKHIFPVLDNLYIDESAKMYKDIDNDFCMSIISLQLLEISFLEKNPRMSQEFQVYLANKYAENSSLKPLIESQAFLGISPVLQSKLRTSIGTERLAQNYLKKKDGLVFSSKDVSDKNV